MYGGRNTSSDRQILVDKTRNRVIFAESDFEFIDSLLSFLTLPLGKVVRLLSSESAAIGSVTRIYGSVSSLESRNLRNDQYKDLLLDPKNASESECNRLKLHACSLGRGIWHTREEDGGVFLKGGAARFMITDDLQVIPGSTAACISLFRKLGIKDGNEVEERTVEIGAKEVLLLLKFALLSKSPLTAVILPNQGSSIKDTVKFQQKKRAQSDKKSRAANSNNMNLKLLVSKSKTTILYAEAGVDVVEFLFSFLTFPIGSVIKLLSKNSGFGCMDNLYKSAEVLSAGSYIKSEECKKILSKLLQIEEAFYPQYKFNFDSGSWSETDAKAESKSSPAEPLEEGGRFPVVMAPTGEINAGKGYMKGPATFMITDNLYVTPLSPIMSVALLNQLNVPINDVVERVVTMGIDEALNLLNASLISKTVLSDVFNQREPHPEVMLKV
ncbi:hypothetical protein CsSME_00041070 [Camellia sinensis var. sinensis]